MISIKFTFHYEHFILGKFFSFLICAIIAQKCQSSTDYPNSLDKTQEIVIHYGALNVIGFSRYY